MNFSKLSLKKVYFIKEKQNMNKNYIGTYGVIKKMEEQISFVQ